MESDVQLAKFSGIFALCRDVDVPFRVHGKLAGSSAEKFGLIKDEQIARRSGHAGLQNAAVQVIQHLERALVVAVVDVIGRILTVALTAKVVSGLNSGVRLSWHEWFCSEIPGSVRRQCQTPF